MRFALGVATLLLAASATATEEGVVQKAQAKQQQDANPFDPSHMLREPLKEEKLKPDRLTEVSVYRIDGVRFQKFYSQQGAVFIESPSSVPDFEQGRVLCTKSMHPAWEVIRIRDGAELSNEVKKKRKVILGHIAKCSG